MGNAVAYAALFAWPLVALVLFAKLPVHKAAIWTILGGYLFLPERTNIDLPLLPAFDKTFIPSAAALLLSLPVIRRNGGILSLLPKARVPRILVILYLLGPFATVLTNQDPDFVGVKFLPGHTLYDAFSFGLTRAVLIVPYLLAQRVMAGETQLRDLLEAIAIAGLAYSLPALFEVRMSPQLHTWIYGFFPHSFGQQVRFGGFRPVVFLGHSLKVGLFLAMTVVAAAALWRLRRHAVWASALVWLVVTLILAKTVGAIALAVLILPFALAPGLTPRRSLFLAAAVMVLLYPVLRGADLIPTGRIESLAAGISPARAQSVGFRFDNEDRLLARANERPLFGWGGWGRNRIYDPDTGHDISTTDGRWVIVTGSYGWLGYITEFGLLTWPLLLFGRRRPGAYAPAAGALGLVLTLNLLDLLPNAGLSPLTWILAGALTGHLARQPVRSALRPAGASPSHPEPAR